MQSSWKSGELEQVELLLDAARHSPRALLIEGEAGSGEDVDLGGGSRGRRAVGVQHGCRPPAEAETSFAYAALGDLLRDRTDALEELPARPRHALEVALLLDDEAAEPPDQQSVALGLLAMLRRLAVADHGWSPSTTCSGSTRLRLRCSASPCDGSTRGRSRSSWHGEPMVERRFRSAWIVHRRASAWSVSHFLRWLASRAPSSSAAAELRAPPPTIDACQRATRSTGLPSGSVSRWWGRRSPRSRRRIRATRAIAGPSGSADAAFEPWSRGASTCSSASTATSRCIRISA